MTRQDSTAENEDNQNVSTGTNSDNKAVKEGSGSSLNDLFTGGASVWIKIIGAAVVTPVIVFASNRRGRNGGVNFLSDFPTAIAVFGGAAIVGAFLGAALSMRDVVDRRLADGKPVGSVLRLFFGRGITTVLVWIPLFIVLLVVVLNLLGL